MLEVKDTIFRKIFTYCTQDGFCKLGKGFSSWVSAEALLLWLYWEVSIAHTRPSITLHLFKGLISC